MVTHLLLILSLILSLFLTSKRFWQTFSAYRETLWQLPDRQAEKSLVYYLLVFAVLVIQLLREATVFFK